MGKEMGAQLAEKSFLRVRCGETSKRLIPGSFHLSGKRTEKFA